MMCPHPPSRTHVHRSGYHRRRSFVAVPDFRPSHSFLQSIAVPRTARNNKLRQVRVRRRTVSLDDRRVFRASPLTKRGYAGYTTQAFRHREFHAVPVEGARRVAGSPQRTAYYAASDPGSPAFDVRRSALGVHVRPRAPPSPCPAGSPQGTIISFQLASARGRSICMFSRFPVGPRTSNSTYGGKPAAVAANIARERRCIYSTVLGLTAVQHGSESNALALHPPVALPTTRSTSLILY